VLTLLGICVFLLRMRVTPPGQWILLWLSVTLFSFGGVCGERDLGEGIGERFDGVRIGGKPGAWCEYIRIGLMTTPLRVVIETNGTVRALVKPVQQAEFRYETQLTPEEQSYLATLFRAGRIVEKPARQPWSGDSAFLLWLKEGDKEALVDLVASDEDRDLIVAQIFFFKLQAQVVGAKALSEGSVYSAMMDKWLQPAKAIQPLKEYLQRPRTWEQARHAWEGLSQVLTAEEWAGYVSLRLRDASSEERSILLRSLTTQSMGFGIRKNYGSLLEMVLKEWKDTDKESMR